MRPTLVVTVCSSLIFMACRSRSFTKLNQSDDADLTFVQSLDSNLKKNNISSLESFLNSEDAQASYKAEWLRHWGKGSNLSSKFDIVLDGLKKDSKKEGAKLLNEALFKSVSMDLKAIRTPIFSQDLSKHRELKYDFAQLFKNFSNDCVTDFPNIFREGQAHFTKPPNRLKEIVDTYISSSNFPKFIDPKLNAKQKRERQSEIFKYLKFNGDLKKVVGFSICQTMLTGDFIPLESQEYVDLAALKKTFLEVTMSNANDSGLFFPRNYYLISEALNRIFPNEIDFGNVNVEPEKTLLLEPVQTPFHSIFKGIELRECVGGDIASSLSPQRWASGALSGAIVYYVSLAEGQSTKFSPVGFLQLTPLKTKISGEQNFAIDFGVRQLSSSGTYFFDEDSGLTGRLVEIVIWRLQQTFPFAHFFKSDSSAINNAGIANLVLNSKMYLDSERRIKRSEFGHVDIAIARDIVSIDESTGVANNYTGNMITDATVKDVTEIRELNTNAISRFQFSKKPFLTTAGVKKALKEARRFINPLQLPKLDLPEVSAEKCDSFIKRTPLKNEMLEVLYCARARYEKNELRGFPQWYDFVDYLRKGNEQWKDDSSFHSEVAHLFFDIVNELNAPKNTKKYYSVNYLVFVFYEGFLKVNFSSDVPLDIQIESSFVIDHFLDLIIPNWQTKIVFPGPEILSEDYRRVIVELVRRSSFPQAQ